MAFLIDQLNNSGLFAQSAYSAGIATCDSDGNIITATYLSSHQPISANEWNSSYETVLTNSASWSGGTVESYDLSAGNNIQITKDDVNSAIGIAVTGLNQTNWNNSYTALTSNSANWNNTRSTVQSNSASWAQGTTYTEGDGIDITNNVISLDSPIVFSAGSGLSVTMDSNTARIDVTAQGGGAATLPISGTDSQSYTSAYYKANGITYEREDRVGEPDIRTLDITPTWITLTATVDEQNYFGFELADDHLSLTSQFDPNCNGTVNAEAISSWNDTYTTYSNNSATYLTAHQTISANEWNDCYDTVQTNSASWAGGSTYTGDAQGALDEVYTNSGNWNDTYTNVSTNSAGWGGDTVALSAGEGIGIDLGVSAVTISSTYGSDISYLSATIGDVESLLAQL